MIRIQPYNINVNAMANTNWAKIGKHRLFEDQKNEIYQLFCQFFSKTF
jgi:hypothetical protein